MPRFIHLVTEPTSVSILNSFEALCIQNTEWDQHSRGSGSQSRIEGLQVQEQPELQSREKKEQGGRRKGEWEGKMKTGKRKRDSDSEANCFKSAFSQFVH